MSLQPANDRPESSGKVVPLLPGPVLDGSRPGEPSTRRDRALGWNWLIVSILAHLIVIEAVLFGLNRVPEPEPVPVLQITLVVEGPGGAGTAKGDNAPVEAPPPQPEPTPPVEAVAPPPEPVPVPVIETPPPPPPVEAVVPPPPAPELKPEPIPEPPTPPVAEKPRIVKAKPKPKPKHEIVRETPTPTPLPVPPAPPSPSVATLPAPNATGTPGSNAAINRGRGVEGAGQGTIGSNAGPGDEYLAALYRHLLRFKKYPADALARKEQGAVVVGFTIARDGTISNPHVVTSSGFAAIDEATVAMLGRASPAPALPGTFKASEARVRISISYKLGLADELF